MAQELDPIKQIIQIDVKETGADAATQDVAKLNTTVKESTTITAAQTKEIKKAEDGYKTLKTQLREAIIEQQKLSAQYGATSAEAIKATKAVAGIKDEIEFQKDLVKSYNPDDKFRKLSQTAGVAALALGGVKEGFTALGIESETLDKIIGSAQALLGVTSAVSGMTDAYAVLTAGKKAKIATDVAEVATTEAVAVAEVEATAATWTWNTALLANPIVLIAAGVIAASAAIYAFVKITSDSAKAEELARVSSMQLEQAIDAQTKSFERNSKAVSDGNKHKIDLLKASGASEAAIYAESKALADQELQLAKNYRAEALRIEQRAYILNRDNPTEFTAKTLADAKENIKKAEDAVSKGYDSLIDLQNNHEVEVEQAKTDARNKAIEEAKKAAEKEAERLKKENEDKLKAAEEAKKEALELEKSEAQQKRDTDAELRAADAERVAIDDENAQKYRDKQHEIEKIDADKRLEIAQYEADQKKIIQDQSLSVAGQAIELTKTLAGKNKAIQKAAIIAESAIGIGKTVQNVVTGNAAALAQGIVQLGPIAGPPSAAPAIALNTVSGGLSIASNIAATTKALSAIGGGGAPSAGGGVPATPTRNVAQVGFQASSENQIATSISQQQGNQQPLQAFVVSQAVTDQQEIDRQKELQNSF